MTPNQIFSKLPVDERGFYGRFGGAYIPEILYKNVETLKEMFYKYVDDAEFNAEFNDLLHNYVGRPSPLYFAKRLSEHYGTNIYLKREDLNHTGAHKINNAIGSALLAKRMGRKRIIAETGAGQHGVATATVCALMGLECVVYMGALDVARQQPNVERMKMLGAKVVSVTSGNQTLKDATNEAIRDWCCNPADTFYIIGSTVGPHPYPEMVARFQSVISYEMKQQLQAQVGRDYPDYVIACVGGGSNAAGAFYHFIDDNRVKLVAAEAAGKGIDSGESAATIHLGREGIIHGSRTLVMQTDDGQITEPYSISAGLDYPGIGPLHAFLAESHRSEVLAITDDEALAGAYRLTALEGIIPALESAHALGVLDKKQFVKDDIVVINLSGRGDKDMATYLRYKK
jgi:tryptophan synthase beta chain